MPRSAPRRLTCRGSSRIVERVSVDQELARARSGLQRISARPTAVAAEHGALLIDIRPLHQRAADGEIPGALVIDRNVLEWRLDPASPDRIAEVVGYDQTIIVFCDEGYASSLAAASLQAVGLRNATDLEGGFQAWRSADLPTSVPFGGA
ncbi:MAG: rhodanese-like domain-containing protein [Acidimicrobiia bacterium]